MNLKEKFFPENRLGLNRFWNFSRGGIDNFRSGLRDVVSGVEQTRSRMMEYDQLLVWAILSLMLIGLVMVYSASITLADGPKYANYSSNFFLIRHMISLVIAIGVGIWVLRFLQRYGIDIHQLFLDLLFYFLSQCLFQVLEKV